MDPIETAENETVVAEAARPAAAPAPETPELVEQDLLVEDVSIDGMCGVY
jgi:mycofactocin precursor